MVFLKLASIITATVMLTFYITFTVTKNHYAAPQLSASACVDTVIPVAVFSGESTQSSLNSSISADNKNVVTHKIAPVAQQEKKEVDIDALMKERDAQQQHINTFRQFVVADHKKPLIDEASLRYEAEVVDYQWAALQEDKLLSTFTSSVSLDPYIPTQMSCRSVTCKIIIPSQDDASADKAYRAVWQVLVNQDSVSSNTITYFRNPEKGEVVMYISSQGNSIFQ